MGEGEEQTLLKSPFEDGLKAAQTFILIGGSVLERGMFDLGSTSR